VVKPGIHPDFPDATLVCVPGAKTWVPVGNPAAVSRAIAEFVPVPGPVAIRASVPGRVPA
jgi:hypothetical protein